MAVGAPCLDAVWLPQPSSGHPCNSHPRPWAWDWACGETIQTSGRAIVTTSLVLSGGFAILAIGSFIPNIYFGVVTSVVVLVAMFADLVTLPAALQFFLGDGRNHSSDEV